MADSAEAHGQRNHQPYMATLLRCRTVVYKVGLMTLLGAFALFVLGFSTSSWISCFEDGHSSDSHILGWSWHHEYGLWDNPCKAHDNACSTALTVSQVVFCLHLVGYFLCFVMAAFENCRRVDVYAYFSRRLELCVLATGMMGTAGMVIFAVWFSNTFDNDGYKWSLAVASLSLTALYITFFMLLCGNRRNFLLMGIALNPRPTTNFVFYPPGQTAGAQVIQTYGPSQPSYPPQPTYPPQQTYPPQPNYPPQPTYPPQTGPQNQPLLPPQPCPYRPAGQQQGAPPAYSFPPAYPNAPMQSQGAVPEPCYPYPPSQQYENMKYANANAPPMEDDTLPMKN